MQKTDYIKSLSNWGRWGKDDKLGTLNFITSRKIVSSARLARDGIAVSCARPIESSTRPDLRSQALSYIVDRNDIRTMDFIGMVFHGKSITHLDSLSHFFWKGKMYNGKPVEDEDTYDPEILQRGILTRGVLLNIHGKMVKSADLELAEKKSGAKVEPGDVLLVRTGKGFYVSATSWLRKREVAIVGSDTPNDAPLFHTVCLTAMGLRILDNCDLEELYRICNKKKRWEFLIFIAPLRLKKVTGSPVNPIAIF